MLPFGKERIGMARAEATREPEDIATFRRIVRRKLGGPNSYVTLLGLKALETPALLERVEAGFPYRLFERFQRNIDLQSDELAKLLQITPRTLARRRKSGRLTSEESDRLLRASRVFGRALALFEGDVEAARAWFATPAPALANRTPRDVSTTEVGAREVESLIGRLEHGVFS
jgi:putative toxin-antitoxin system antitoxin component (TIGR02293 family)